MTNIAISYNDYLIKENPRIVFEGAEPVYTMNCPGISSILNDSTLVMYVYKNGTDATSTFTTGSMTAAGNVVQLKKLTGLKGGDKLFVTVFGTGDGIVDCLAAFDLWVMKRSGRS